jgi:hypothetical protein
MGCCLFRVIQSISFITRMAQGCVCFSAAQEVAALVAGATPPDVQARRPQPFTMHKMAFHRGRALAIIRRSLRSALPPPEPAAQSGARPLTLNPETLTCLRS